MKPTISCCHATARAKMAIQCFNEWRRNCAEFGLIEWIFAVDITDLKTIEGITEFILNFSYPNVRIELNRGHQTAVAALNKAARMARGDILVDVCDDVGCPKDWDNIMRECIPDHGRNVFLRFGDGQNSELCTHPVISRRRYEILGYFIHPDFDCTHKFAYKDATVRAKKDGSLVERLDVIFEHRHPAFGKGIWDDVYTRQSAYQGEQEILWKHHPELKK